MSRIDVHALVLAFENRIAALDKNPLETVPQKTISLMLENALEDEIKKHFTYRIKRDIRLGLKKEFNKLRVKMVKEMLKDLLTDNDFKETVSFHIKHSIINGISK